MKKILILLGVSSLIAGGTPFGTKSLVNNQSITQIENSLNKNESRVEVTNLSRIKINEFTTDLSIFGSNTVTKEDYLEEIKWAMIEENQEHEDLLFDIFDSVIYDEPQNWTISGLSWEIPEHGNESYVRVRFQPKNIIEYSGALSFKTILSNTSKNTVDISNLIENTFLGTILDNNPITLKTKIEAKNNKLVLQWNQIRIANITEHSASLIAVENSSVYKGAIVVEFKIGLNLNKVIKNNKLGKIVENIDGNLLLSKVKNVNQDLLVDQLKVENIDLNKGTATILPKDDLGDYVGESNVSFVDSKHLSAIINQSYLGSLTNPTLLDLQNKVVQLNSGITRSDFTILNNSLSYSKFTIVATNSSKYHGEVDFTFNGDATALLHYDSGQLSVSAYATTKTDKNSGSMLFQPSLGKEAFLRSYKYLQINTLLNAWMNGTPSMGELIDNQLQSFRSSLSVTNVKTNFYRVKYVNVNWMTCHSTFQYYWVGDKLNIEIWTMAEAFASGWNAYRAKAKSRTIVNSVSFF